MAYNTVKPDVERIKRETRDTGGLPRAIAELSMEQALRLIELAECSEGSEKKGYLEEAIQHLEGAYHNHPDPKLADLLSRTYRMFGAAKEEAGMPGYEEDFAKSEFYQKHAERADTGHHKN